MSTNNQTILALGAEMKGSFCIAKNEKMLFSECFGNLSDRTALDEYKKRLNNILKTEKIIPDIILHDLHPTYNTTLLAGELAKKFNARLVPIQHHLAHAYSVASEHNIDGFIAIVCDGTGFGLDGNVWGGEVFSNNERIGHLEEQYLLGSESAVNNPTKFLFSILSGFMKEEKELHKVMLPFFSATELKVLKKQLAEKFNCPITTSCGRILDAASVLLSFCREKTFDGSPAILLEQNSTEPYELEPIIKEINNKKVLMTTPIFEFLINNMHLPHQRLAATVQKYLAEGLFMIAKQHSEKNTTSNVLITFSGGCANNRIMTSHLKEKGVLTNKKIDCGDGGVALGQIRYYLTNNQI
jgi:hydrogenase maturation protein HypF